MFDRHFPALKYRNFRLFLIGQLISLVGSWMQVTVQPYLAYRITDQPIYLGAIGFASALPVFFLAIPGGVFIERLNKRKTVIVLQVIMMFQAFTLAVLTLTGIITIWHIIFLALILGITNSLEITARQAMLIELVEKDALPNAIALNSTIFNTARVIGPTMAAPFLVLLKNSGEGWAFFSNGVSYLFVIIGLLMIRTHTTNIKLSSHQSVLNGFLEGARYIRKTTIVALLIFSVFIPSVFGFPLIQFIPVFARDVLATAFDTPDVVATRNSMMLVAQGVGAFIASLSISFFSTNQRKALWLTAGQVIFGLAILGLGFCKDLSQALPLMALSGWGMVTQLSMTNTLIQMTVPDNLRGRVLSIFIWSMQGFSPFGSLLLGWMFQNWGASNSVLIGGSLCLIGYACVHIMRPTLYRMKG